MPPKQIHAPIQITVKTAKNCNFGTQCPITDSESDLTVSWNRP